jgi:hypothetical protein
MDTISYEQLLSISSLKEAKELFCQLNLMSTETLCGTYEGTIVGPAWIRKIAPLLLIVTGLKGWQGKEFDANGEGFNRCLQNGFIEKIGPMKASGIIPSIIDGKPTLSIGPREPSLLERSMRDEVRISSDNMTILGFSYANVEPLRRLPMPFVLRRLKNV